MATSQMLPAKWQVPVGTIQGLTTSVAKHLVGAFDAGENWDQAPFMFL